MQGTNLQIVSRANGFNVGVMQTLCEEHNLRVAHVSRLYTAKGKRKSA